MPLANPFLCVVFLDILQRLHWNGIKCALNILILANFKTRKLANEKEVLIDLQLTRGLLIAAESSESVFLLVSRVCIPTFDIFEIL